MDKQEHKTTPPQVDEQRRRLTKGGLAVPVVMATLASSRALAGAPHNCTISGKLSGNTSGHGGELTCTIGRSPGYWKNHRPWCTWDPNQLFSGSTFDGAVLPDTFWWKVSNNQKVWVTPFTIGATRATLLQVLDAAFVSGNQGNTAKPYAALARAVIATVQNFCVHGSDYAIRASQAIQMYVSVYQSGKYEVKTGVYWSANCCTYYLESLYNLESGESFTGSNVGCVGL